MQYNKHESDIYFYDDDGRLVANYDSYSSLVDIERMLTVDEIEYINNKLKDIL